MVQFDTLWTLWDEEERFGDYVFDAAMPSAIRTLEDGELQVLLVALLHEWRNRKQLVDRTMSHN